MKADYRGSDVSLAIMTTATQGYLHDFFLCNPNLEILTFN